MVPAILWGLAWTLGRRELALYGRRDSEEADVFVYTRGRLVRRLTGVGLLVGLGAAFAALGFFPPTTPGEANVYLGVFAGGVILLIVLPVWDLVETARTAKPGKGIRHGK